MCTGSAFQTPQPSCRTSSRQIYYPQQHDSHTNQQQAPIMAPPSSHSLMETSSTVSSNAPPTESKACTAVRYGLPTPVEELVSVSDTTSAYCAKSTAAFTCGNECTSPCPTKITNHQPCDGDVDYSGGDGDSFTDLTTLYSTTSGEHCASAGGFEHGGDRNNEMDECYNCNCDEEQEEERGKEAEEDDCYFISDGEDSESMDLILDGDHHVKRKGGYPAFVQFTNQINYSHHSHNTNNVQQHVIEQPVAVRHL